MATTKKERKTISELAARLQVLEEENRVLKIDIRLINETLVHIQSILNEEVEMPEQEEEADSMPSKFSEFVRENIQRLINEAVIEGFDDFAERIGLDPRRLQTTADNSCSCAQLIEMGRLFGVPYEIFERYITAQSKMANYKAVCEAARKSEQECPDDPISWLWYGFDRLGKNSKQVKIELAKKAHRSESWAGKILNNPFEWNPTANVMTLIAAYFKVNRDNLFRSIEEEEK